MVVKSTDTHKGTCMHRHTHLRTETGTLRNTHVYTDTYTHHAHTHTYTHTNRCTHTHTQTHAHTHKHTHTHMHKHMHFFLVITKDFHVCFETTEHGCTTGNCLIVVMVSHFNFSYRLIAPSSTHLARTTTRMTLTRSMHWRLVLFCCQPRKWLHIFLTPNKDGILGELELEDEVYFVGYQGEFTQKSF